MTDLSLVGTLATKTVRRRVRASHLRAARDAVGLSQEGLAKRLDVRVPTISERENSGDDVVKGEGVAWEVWLAWATALELPVDWEPGAPRPKTSKTKRKPDA